MPKKAKSVNAFDKPKKAKGEKKQKSGLTMDQENEILYMKPADLAVEAAREDNALDVLREQLKKDGKIKELQDEIDKLKKELETEDEVVAAKDALEQMREKHTPDALKNAKLDIKALKKGWNADIRSRSKRHKFMKKTLKKHMESGALKSKLD